MNANNTHIKNLVVLACADGDISENELAVLFDKAREAGIPESDLNLWINHADDLVMDFPETNVERERQLINMINLSNSDGHFSQSEYDLCQLMADKLTYSGLSEALNMRMNRAHLKNLIALACSDGSLEKSELAILKDAAELAGVSKTELDELISRGNEFKYLIPESYEDRETQLIQMLTLAIADDQFSADEYNLCKSVAEKLDFTEKELRLIIKLSFKGEFHFPDENF